MVRRGKRTSKAKGWKKRELFRRVIITNDTTFQNESDFCQAVHRALSTKKPIIEHLEGEE